jgi:hypothetical protein
MTQDEYKDYNLPTDAVIAAYLYYHKDKDDFLAGAKWMRDMAVKAMDEERLRNIGAFVKILKEEGK